jgi:hypothetical protein
MNKRENTIVLRLYSILHDVPGCHLGVSTQSASLDGLCAFAKDMTAIKKPMEDVLYHVRVAEYERAEMLLSALEHWIEKRKKADWQDVYPFPQVEMVKK